MELLSRTSLYAPLSTYTKKQGSASTTKTNKNVQEESLTDFWRRVSDRYHSNKDSSHCRNSGNRPLTNQEINGSIRQRTLTLVGGGFNSKWGAAAASNGAGAKRTSHNPATGRQTRKRRRKEATDASKAGPSKADVTFLRQLHAQWLDYMVQMLGLSVSPTVNSGGEKKRNTESVSIHESLQVLANRAARVLQGGNGQTLELVGAAVRILACSKHVTWVGATGILVETMAETYTIVEQPLFPVESATESEGDDVDAVLEASMEGQASVQVGPFSESKRKAPTVSKATFKHKQRTLVVPKRGSSLGLLLPADRFVNVDATSNTSHGAVSTRHICIVLAE